MLQLGHVAHVQITTIKPKHEKGRQDFQKCYSTFGSEHRPDAWTKFVLVSLGGAHMFGWEPAVCSGLKRVAMIHILNRWRSQSIVFLHWRCIPFHGHMEGFPGATSTGLPAPGRHPCHWLPSVPLSGRGVEWQCVHYIPHMVPKNVKIRY